MSIRQLIQKEVARLPDAFQREVYDFARFLGQKNRGKVAVTKRRKAVRARKLIDSLEAGKVWKGRTSDILKHTRSEV